MSEAAPCKKVPALAELEAESDFLTGLADGWPAPRAHPSEMLAVLGPQHSQSIFASGARLLAVALVGGMT